MTGGTGGDGREKRDEGDEGDVEGKGVCVKEKSEQREWWRKGKRTYGGEASI